MDLNYVNPFCESFESVMPKIGLTEVKNNGVSLKGRFLESQGIMIIVGIMGDIKGSVIYSTTLENAKKLASVMMKGKPVYELEGIAESAVSELTNMLTANAATNFSMKDITVKISPPILMYGNFTANASTNKVFCVEMVIDDMILEVNVALENLQ